MNARDLEDRIQAAISRAGSGSCPPKLAEALRYALFPGGGRVRPRLVLACAEAIGEPDSELAASAAVAVELIHGASLVHDDMPCFDNADTRRGKLSVHRAFGEEIALLVGDALISLAYEELARAGISQPQRMGRMIRILARGLGSAHGIIGGQGWESEAQIDLAVYHRAKTGALFEAATELGAVAAGRDGASWRRLGGLLGEAYQLADDLADALGSAASLGKPVRQDEQGHAPNAVQNLGVMQTLTVLEERIRAAVDAVPDCPGRAGLVELVEFVGKRLCPPQLKNQPASQPAAAHVAA